jgi:uncharacterized protein YegL
MMSNEDISYFEVDDIEIPKNFHQLGVLVLDGSGSMHGNSASGNQSKAEAVNSAVKELLSRLKISNNKKNFSIAVVTFDGNAKVHTETTPVEEINDLGDYNPLNGHGGGTNIPTALEEAKKIVKEHIDIGNMSENDGIPHSAVVIVMSDGMTSGNPIFIADEIKKEFEEQVTICSTMFATKGKSHPDAVNALRSISTTPDQHYITVYDGEALRDFFLASVSSGANVDI